MALVPQWGAPLTYDDLQELRDDGHRYELVDGTLLVTPAPDRAHQVCVVQLVVVLTAAAGPGLLVLAALYDWKVGAATSFQPDLVAARRDDVGRQRLEAVPLLVVEVLSPNTRLTDLGTKRLAYEAAGVAAYWLVDPNVPSVTALRLEGGRYVEEAEVAGDEPCRASFPVEATVVPNALLGGLRR